jgi:glutathione S-transferase
MKLYGTYPSHFTRKVRIVLAELGIPYEFEVLAGLMLTGPEHFAQNPLHQLPILVDGNKNIIESDIICEYLIEKFGAKNTTGLNRFLPSPENKYDDLKRLAIMNGAMSAGVKLIRAKRSEIPNYENFVFFKQEREALLKALEWLNQDLGKRSAYYPGQFTMLEITLMSLCEWVVYREMVPNLDPYPQLSHFVHTNCGRASFAKTHPSLTQ